MPSILRQRILEAPDRKRDQGEIEAWGVKVEFRSMSAGTRNEFLSLASEKGFDGEKDQARLGGEMLKLFPKFVVDGLYDPDTGEKIFTDADLPALLEKDGEVLQEVAMKIMALSGLGKDALGKAGKDSSSTPSGDSSSSSQTA